MKRQMPGWPAASAIAAWNARRLRESRCRRRALRPGAAGRSARADAPSGPPRRAPPRAARLFARAPCASGSLPEARRPECARRMSRIAGKSRPVPHRQAATALRAPACGSRRARARSPARRSARRACAASTRCRRAACDGRGARCCRRAGGGQDAARFRFAVLSRPRGAIPIAIGLIKFRLGGIDILVYKSVQGRE